MSRLASKEIDDALQDLPEWRLDDGKLYREFKFADFARAVGFMTAVAIHAEAMNHHPEWFNVYDTVRVWLTTHDVGGISVKDLELARHINELHKQN